jgi:hypothetical protein
VGTDLLCFTNPTFRLDEVPASKLRVTNAGFLIVTHEFDPETFTRLSIGFLITEAIASFTAGSKSLHFHFMFDTRHLTAAVPIRCRPSIPMGKSSLARVDNGQCSYPLLRLYS